MRVILAAIVGCCLYLAASAEASKFMDDPGFYWEARPRLGHFARHPYTDLYLNYAASFVKPLHKERSNDDFRNYVPSADECMVFFTEFRSQGYQIHEIEKFVLLDACLGYLYESEFHDKDKEASQYVNENLNALIADEQLKQLFESTKIVDIPAAAQDCVGNLLLNSIRAKKQFGDVACNNDWLELFNRFAECHKEIPADARETDSYLNVIYGLVKQRGRACFDNEIFALNTAVRAKYANSMSDRVGNKVGKFFSWQSKQADTRVWPKEIMRVLTAVQNPTKEINLRQVAQILKGVYAGEQNWIGSLTRNLAVAADKAIKPKRENPGNDPNGVMRYKHYVDDLCNFFRSSDNKNYYDYTTPFNRMIKMLAYPEIFDISRKYFIDNVLTGGFETAPLYLTVSSCNVLTFTEGSFNTMPQNHALSYRVTFKPDLTKMVIWPDIGFN